MRRMLLAALALVAIAAPARAAQGEQDALRNEALARVRANRQGITAKLREALAADNAAALAQARAAFRQSVTAELLLETAGMSAEERAQAIRRRAAAAAERWNRARQTARDYLINRLRGTPTSAREPIFDSVADSLDAARAEMEMTAEAVRRVDPMVETANGLRVNATQDRLRELLDRITSNYVEEPLRPSYGIKPGDISGAPDEERQAEYWLRQREREADVAEYVRLARGGVMVDPATGAVIEGTERQRLARNAEQQLVDALRRANLNEGVLATLMGFADTRGAVAGERAADIAASDEYRALDFIMPSLGGAQAQEIFRALAVAVRQEQDRINSWRVARIPEGGQGGVSGWLYENFVAKQKVGLGRASEIGGWGLTRDSLEEIDRRIAIFQRDADAVVAAFAAAAQTPNPKDLPRAQHRLLEQYGYIARDAEGNETYKIPTDARVSQRIGRNLNLPGASWLDIISGANVMKLVVLAAAPELAAARFGVLLEGLELGAGTVRIGVFVAESLAGTALDAGISLATGEKIDAERMAIESLFLAPIVQGASRAAGEAGSALASLFKDRARRQTAEAFLTQTLGLASESALQTYWQANLQGKVTYEDFLSNLVNGAISRGARGALDRAADARGTAVEAIRGYRQGRVEIPPALDPVFAGPEGRAARTETLDRAAESQKQFDEAVRQLREVVGDDLSHADAPARLVSALEQGRYTWADLKTLYRRDPARMKPLMAAANAARARFADRIVADARIRARENIDADHRANAARLSEALKNDPAQLKEALAANDAWRTQQLDLVAKDPFAPGSKDVTSDIDRSTASPYLRNALKEISDLLLAVDGSRPPTTARAYDLNEYIDVFPIIKRTKEMDLSRESTPGFPGLTHRQAIEAIALSAAMLHMSPAQRARFKENTIAAAPAADQPRVRQQFQLAEASLNRGERDLKAEIDRLVAAGADRSSPDTVTRARDNLYGQRTQRLHDLESQLARVQPGSDEARRLAAEIEREWSFTLREGIETYSTFAGLDVIVVEGQLKEVSIRQLIDRAGFTADALGMTREQARAMLNDQTLMIVEHVRAFQEGHESTLDAASALGKYAERAVLALKLAGEDIRSGPAAALDAIAKLLVENRKDPAALKEQLEAFGNGDADRGLQNLVNLIEVAVPGLQGVFDPSLQPAPRTAGPPARADVTTPEGIARTRALLALQREREREQARDRAHYGDQSAAAAAAARLEEARAELAALKDEKARADHLRANYNPGDWNRAEQLEGARASITRQIQMLPDQGTPGAVGAGLRQQAQLIEGELQTLRARRTATASAPTDEDFVRDQRIGVLEREIPVQEKQVSALMEAAERERRALDTAQVETEAPSPVSPAPMNEFERAGAMLFSDLDREKIVGRGATAHESAGTGLTPRTPGSGGSTAGITPPEPETVNRVGGFSPSSSVPPIDFHIFPGLVPDDESFVSLDIDDFFHAGPTFINVLPDRTTQHMITIVELPAGTTIAGRREPAPEEAGIQAGQIRMIVTSLGTSTGEAFEAHIVNDGDKPVRITGGGALVLEPLTAGAIPQAQQAIRALSPAQTATAKLTAYCLEFLRKPPAPGMVFRVASQELQQKFAPLKDVLDAARRLEQLGVLKPDGNPVAYFHAIRQWSMWTREQGFDLKRFTSAFVERTKQNFASLGQTWTKEVEAAVLARVPGRWADITRVLQEVDKRAPQPAAVR